MPRRRVKACPHGRPVGVKRRYPCPACMAKIDAADYWEMIRWIHAGRPRSKPRDD